MRLRERIAADAWAYSFRPDNLQAYQELIKHCPHTLTDLIYILSHDFGYVVLIEYTGSMYDVHLIASRPVVPSQMKIPSLYFRGPGLWTCLAFAWAQACILVQRGAFYSVSAKPVAQLVP